MELKNLEKWKIIKICFRVLKEKIVTKKLSTGKQKFESEQERKQFEQNENFPETMYEK